jgi:formate dehydrogenase iron-sulfur subunit
VIYTAKTKGLAIDDVIESCPYNIPRNSADGVLAKCDMCLDRVQNGLQPACVQTCPTGAMNFGEREEIRNLAQRHLAEAKKKFPKAQLLDADDVRVIFLTAFEPLRYHENAVAAEGIFDITRQVALQRMLRPVRDIFSHLL